MSYILHVNTILLLFLSEQSKEKNLLLIIRKNYYALRVNFIILIAFTNFSLKKNKKRLPFNR